MHSVCPHLCLHCRLLEDAPLPVPGTPVAVSWADITDADDWNEPQDPETAQIVTYGVFVAASPLVLVIARDYDPEEKRYVGLRAIPLHPVSEVHSLREDGVAISLAPPFPKENLP